MGSDEGTDIVLLKIDLSGLTAVTLADSDAVKVGDYVIAIGNPFGIGQTVTTGIVSALDRATSRRSGQYQNYIQTDAAINQGNSGGALLNSRGELIGINAAIMSRSGGSNGIGFAVPANMITAIMDQLVNYGEVRRGRIGVSIQNITPELMAALALTTDKGALVADVVEGSPADDAGLEAGDVITVFNGTKILNSNDIRMAVGFVERGHKAKLIYLRDGKERSIDIWVEQPEGADEQAILEESAVPETLNLDAFEGAEFSDIPEDLNTRGGNDGVLVTRIKRSSPSWEAGLRRGDIIRSIGNTKITDLESFETMAKTIDAAVALSVQRNRSRVFIAIK